MCLRPSVDDILLPRLCLAFSLASLGLRPPVCGLGLCFDPLLRPSGI
jgi:hypothetical protein